MNHVCIFGKYVYEKYKRKITVMEFQSCKSAHSVCETFLTKQKKRLDPCVLTSV